jgi:hypothetical protein
MDNQELSCPERYYLDSSDIYEELRTIPCRPTTYCIFENTHWDPNDKKTLNQPRHAWRQFKDCPTGYSLVYKKVLFSINPN